MRKYIKTGLSGYQKPGLHRAFALHIDGAAVFKIIIIFEKLLGRGGYLYAALRTMGFHPAGGVDRVPPQVVDEPTFSNYTGYHGAGTNSDSHPKGYRHRHVGVTDGLDFSGPW